MPKSAREIIEAEMQDWGCDYAFCGKARESLISALESAGYCIVPLEPTPEMMAAGIVSIINEPLILAYRAMLASRPKS